MTLLAPALDGPTKKGTIRSNGQTLAYEQFGSDDDPVILLIMGLGTQLLAWPDAFCQALANSHYRVIRFDNRDTGLSSKFDLDMPYDGPRRAMLKTLFRRSILAPYTLADMTDDAMGLLDGLGIWQAHVVGASMGGMIAQLMAGQYPDRILSLTSIMSSSGARRLPRGRLRVLRRLIMRPPGNSEKAVVNHMTRTMSMISGRDGLSPEGWADELRKAYRRSYYPPGTARQLLAVLDAPSRVELLRRIQQPALVIHGASDPLLPIKHGRDTAKHLHNARYEEVPGMGHCLPPARLSDFVDMIVTLADGANQNTVTVV